MIASIVDAAKDGFITLKVRVCDVCGDHWHQEQTPGNGWHEWIADDYRLYKCPDCGLTACHSCLADRWCCNETQPVEKQRMLFEENA